MCVEKKVEVSALLSKSFSKLEKVLEKEWHPPTSRKKRTITIDY